MGCRSLVVERFASISIYVLKGLGFFAEFGSVTTPGLVCHLNWPQPCRERRRGVATRPHLKMGGGARVLKNYLGLGLKARSCFFLLLVIAFQRGRPETLKFYLHL